MSTCSPVILARSLTIYPLKGTRKRRTVVVSMVADLPPAVLKAAKKWESHIPFTFLSDEFIKLPTAKLTSFAHSVLSHPLIDTVTSEDRLDVKTWERCCRRYLSLLQKIFPALATEWEDYYNESYFGGKISDARWQTRLEYNILHRSHTLPSEGESPDDGIDTLWVIAEESAMEKAKADARLEAAEDAKRLIALSSSSRHWPDRPQRNQQPSSDMKASGESGFPTAKGVRKRSRRPKKLPRERHNFASPAAGVATGPAPARLALKSTARNCLSPEMEAECGPSSEVLTFASTLMEATDAPTPPAPIELTYAPSAKAPTMAPSSARLEAAFPIVTPLNAERWRSALNDLGILDQFSDVVNGIERGFPLNSSICIDSSRIYTNHNSATEHPDVIEEMISSELAARRFVGPFSQAKLENLIGPFIAHPLGLAPKSDGTWRLVEDLSYPRSGPVPSFNSMTDISDLPVDWGGFKEMAELVVTAPPGSQGATFNWKNAFRTCPISRDDLWTGVISWRKEGNPSEDLKFWVDGCLKYGNTRSPGIFNRVNKAFVVICEIKGYGIIIFWVDDLTIRRIPINFSPPWRYSFDIDDICEVARYLGAPFSTTKLAPFSSSTRYIGFIWCWDSKVVTLPGDKRLEVRVKVEAALNLDMISLKSLHSLSGSLSHVSMVVPEGRSNLRGLWNFLVSMSKSCSSPHSQRAWTPSACKDLEWWNRMLDASDISMRLCTEVTPDDSFHVFSDASTSWGIGVVIGSEYDRFKLAVGWENWEGEPKDIGWLEFLGLELAVFFLLTKYRLRNRHILIHVDNQGVVGAWNARVSRNPAQNTVLARIIRMLLRAQCFVSLVYVASADNPADAPSRGLSPEGLSRTHFPGFPTALRHVLTRE